MASVALGFAAGTAAAAGAGAVVAAGAGAVVAAGAGAAGCAGTAVGLGSSSVELQASVNARITGRSTTKNVNLIALKEDVRVT
jgi:hypothetical protein